MKKQEAEKILKDKAERAAAEIEAVQTLEEAKKKEQLEKEAAEKVRIKEQFEAEKKRYPDFAAELYQNCWKCKKVVNMSQGEHITRSTRIIIVAECQKCNSFNVAVVPTNNKITSSHDRFFAGIDLNLS